jgi:hypothetical protein
MYQPQVRAETESLDTDLKRNTPAMQKVFEERFQAARGQPGNPLSESPDWRRITKCSLLDRHSTVSFAMVSGRGSVAAYMAKTYSDWLGRQVVLQIEAGESLIPLRGLVVNESNNALRFRFDGGWEVDIFKSRFGARIP